MTIVKFILPSGEVCVEDAADGQSVMKAAKQSGIESIIAECGGSLSCATCHVYVDDKWVDQLPRPDEAEEDLLECVPDREPGSRLSCQIILDGRLDGICVRLPAAQY